MSDQAAENAVGNRPAPLAGEVQAGPLAPLPAGYYDLPTIPDWATGLNDRRRKYVEAYLSNGFNSVAACREAGYNEKRGTLLRHDPRIIKAIEGAMRDSGIARQDANGAACRSRIFLAVEINRYSPADIS